MFELTDSKVESTSRALDIRVLIRAAYNNAKEIEELLSIYGSDLAYTAAVNAIYSVAERQELNALAIHFSNLVTELETNHGDILVE